jgi:hypothetical protein
MSEYQYYEFQAIDCPLDGKAQSELRAITSRATITPTSLINVYHFGDFKGNPDKLMEKYFDAFLYVANWGTRRLMLRLPARTFDLTEGMQYCVPEGLRIRASGEHVILDFHSDAEGGDDFEEGEGWLARLIPLRSDLLAGDLRCLYLAWLSGIEAGADEDALEPPVLPGLQHLSGSLEALADFLRVDPNLIEVAARASMGEAPAGPSAEELARWVTALSDTEKVGLLVRLMQGEASHLGGELLQRFRTDLARSPATALAGDLSPSPARRIIGSLLEARDQLEEVKRRQRAEHEAKERERRAREKAAARARYLDSLVGREGELWRQVEAAIATKQPKQYEHAISLMTDLRDLEAHTGKTEGFATRLRQVRERHSSKRSLIQRMDRAGLP